MTESEELGYFNGTEKPSGTIENLCTETGTNL